MGDLIARLRALSRHEHSDYSIGAEAAAALEAAREAAEYMKAQVKWEHCDCGCPAAQKPADVRSVTWLRAADMVRRAIARKEARND